MTTFDEFERDCAVCGSKSKQMELVSTTLFGSPDLDFRPPPLARDALAAEVQECPGCGYCGRSIAKAPRNARASVASARYRTQRRNRRYPPLADRFLCWAMVEEGARRFSQAGHAAIRAAWTCDDAAVAAAARRCRDVAVRLFQKARTRGQRFAERRSAEDVLLVDLLRRANHFREATRLARARLQRPVNAIDAAVLRFQLALLAEKDTGVHQLALAATAGGCGAPPEYLRSVWPSWHESLEAWVRDPKAFLAVATRCSSLADLWQRLMRPDWVLWLYGRGGGPPNDGGLQRFWAWCMRRAIDGLVRAEIGVTELENLVAMTGQRACGEVSADEWNEALITFVRRRPTDHRHSHEQWLFDQCRALGRGDVASLLKAAENASQTTLRVLAHDSRSRRAEHADQVTKLRELVVNPFLTPPTSSS